METLYERIDRLCKDRGHTIGSMCKATGISSGSMAGLHKDPSKSITSKTAKKIAAFLNVSTDAILGTEPPQTTDLTPEEFEWLDRFRSLTPEQRDAFWKLVGRNDA